MVFEGYLIINSGDQIRSSFELERESPKSGLNLSANFRFFLFLKKPRAKN